MDAWAYKEGTPEDDEDETARTLRDDDQGAWGLDRQDGMEMGVLERDKNAARKTRKQEDGEDAQEQTQ